MSTTDTTNADQWWLWRWRYWLTTSLALSTVICGIATMISVLPSCIIGGILQVLCALVTLAIEAPAIVSFIDFLKPIGQAFEGRSNWLKALLYVGLFILPMFPACFGVAYVFGLVFQIAIAVIYGLLAIRVKVTRTIVEQPYAI